MDMLQYFPANAKVAFETVVQKRLFSAPVCMLMPKGARSWAWFTTHGDTPACYLLETDDPKSIRVVDASFSTSLSYGTLLQGVYFRSATKRPMFVVDDVVWYKGKNVVHSTYETRLEILLGLMQNDVGAPINDYMATFGMPVLASSVHALLKMPCPYAVDRIVYRFLDMNRKIFAQPWSADIHRTVPGLAPKASFKHATDQQQPPVGTAQRAVPTQISATASQIPVGSSQRQIASSRRYFWVTAEPKPDIYSLYDDKTNTYIGTACVQTYETSAALNVMFRRVKAVQCFDQLEDSDDEEEFEKEACIDATKRVRIECQWVPRFRRWMPMV